MYMHMYVTVCECARVCVCSTVCFAFTNQQYKYKISNVLSVDLCNMHLTIHPFITVSRVHERHL